MDDGVSTVEAEFSAEFSLLTALFNDKNEERESGHKTKMKVRKTTPGKRVGRARNQKTNLRLRRCERFGRLGDQGIRGDHVLEK